MKNCGKQPSWNFKLTHNFLWIVARIAKFDLFDFRQTTPFIANTYIQYGTRTPSWILKLHIPSILLQLESLNCIYFLQYLISHILVYIVYNKHKPTAILNIYISNNLHSITAKAIQYSDVSWSQTKWTRVVSTNESTSHAYALYLIEAFSI